MERKLAGRIPESGLMITYYTDVRSQLLSQRVDERYIPVIEYAVQNGSVTNSDVQRILNTNRTTAYRLLQQMGTWLEMQGVTGKSTYYTIKGLPNASQTLPKISSSLSLSCIYSLLPANYK